MAEMSAYILDNVKFGNSIYPTNAHEVQMRRDAFISARARLYSLVSELEAGKEAYGISTEDMCGWMELIRPEIDLLSGLLKKDQERYRSLMDK